MAVWAPFNNALRAREALAKHLLTLPRDAAGSLVNPPAHDDRLLVAFRDADTNLRALLAEAQTHRKRTDGDVVTPRKRRAGAAVAAGGEDFGTNARDIQRIRASLESIVQLQAAVSVLFDTFSLGSRLLTAVVASRPHRLGGLRGGRPPWCSVRRNRRASRPRGG